MLGATKGRSFREVPRKRTSRQGPYLITWGPAGVGFLGLAPFGVLGFYDSRGNCLHILEMT